MQAYPKFINFGDQIKKVRESLNYTQDYVASELGLSQRAFSKIENNETRITGDVLIALSRIYKKDIVELIPQDAVLTYNNYKTHNGDAIVYNKTNTEKLEELYRKIVESKEREIQSLKKLVETKEE